MTDDKKDSLKDVLTDIEKVAQRLGVGLWHYILDENHNPVPCTLMTWALWFEHGNRVVRQDRIGDYFISTVFLGLDHSWSRSGPPILFETMVFIEADGKRESDGCERYATWDEALAGHMEVLERIKSGG